MFIISHKLQLFFSCFQLDFADELYIVCFGGGVSLSFIETKHLLFKVAKSDQERELYPHVSSDCMGSDTAWRLIILTSQNTFLLVFLKLTL